MGDGAVGPAYAPHKVTKAAKGLQITREGYIRP